MQGCGNRCGQHFPNHPDYAINQSTVVVKRVAVVTLDANTSRQPTNAQHSQDVRVPNLKVNTLVAMKIV